MGQSMRAERGDCSVEKPAEIGLSLPLLGSRGSANGFFYR